MVQLQYASVFFWIAVHAQSSPVLLEVPKQSQDVFLSDFGWKCRRSTDVASCFFALHHHTSCHCSDWYQHNLKKMHHHSSSNYKQYIIQENDLMVNYSHLPFTTLIPTATSHSNGRALRWQTRGRKVSNLNPLMSFISTERWNNTYFSEIQYSVFCPTTLLI